MSVSQKQFVIEVRVDAPAWHVDSLQRHVLRCGRNLKALCLILESMGYSADVAVMSDDFFEHVDLSAKLGRPIYGYEG